MLAQGGMYDSGTWKHFFNVLPLTLHIPDFNKLSILNLPVVAQEPLTWWCSLIQILYPVFRRSGAYNLVSMGFSFLPFLDGVTRPFLLLLRAASEFAGGRKYSSENSARGSCKGPLAIQFSKEFVS